MSNKLTIPKGATHILNDEFYMKWVGGVEHAFLNGGWVKAKDGWSLDKWQSEYPEQIKELSK